MFYLSVVVNYVGQQEVPHLIVLWIRWELLIFLHIDGFIRFSSITNSMSNQLKVHSSAVHLCHPSPPLDNGKRRMGSQGMDIESVGAQIEWTEHVRSSFGCTYIYNKQLGMSQWKTPMGMVKRLGVMPGNEKGALWLCSFVFA